MITFYAFQHIIRDDLFYPIDAPYIATSIQTLLDMVNQNMPAVPENWEVRPFCLVDADVCRTMEEKLLREDALNPIKLRELGLLKSQRKENHDKKKKE